MSSHTKSITTRPPFIRLARLARYLRYTRLVVDESITNSSPINEIELDLILIKS